MPSILLGLVLIAYPAGGLRAQGTFFSSNEFKIHYSEKGSGIPVILVHGFAVNGTANWTASGIRQSLATSCRVVMLDVRGHGVSAKPTDPKDYGVNMVQDVVNLMDHLQIEKAHVVGYSMGGLIAMKLAMTNPERLYSASVCGAAWLRPDQEEAPEFIQQVAESLEQGDGPLPLLLRLNPTESPLTLARVKATNQFLKMTNNGNALAAVFRSIPQLAVTEAEIKKCQVPIQVIVGTRDPAPTSVPELKSIAPETLKIVEIQGADHFSTIHHPELTGMLKSFVDSHSR